MIYGVARLFGALVFIWLLLVGTGVTVWVGWAAWKTWRARRQQKQQAMLERMAQHKPGCGPR